MRKAVESDVHSEQLVAHGRRVTLSLQVGRVRVPALLLLPALPQPAPAALLLHGFSLRKEVMADVVGVALLRRGVASLALDLPMHGSRGDPLQLQAMRNPLELASLWRLALREAALGLRYLRQLPEVQADRVAVMGYSLGSFLSVFLAGSDPSVRAVVLAAGGDLPAGTPLGGVARAVADPLRAVRKLRGRPLLMVNGRFDPVIRPVQAERLFAAAGEPKVLRWWDAGHGLQSGAVEYAADWLVECLREGG